MYYLALVAAVIVCVEETRPSNTPTNTPTRHVEENLGNWYGLYTKPGLTVIKICVFPFTYNGVEHRTCYTPQNNATARPWCPTVPNFTSGDQYGRCTKVAERNPRAMVSRFTNPDVYESDTCYTYSKRAGLRSKRAVWYAQLWTYKLCQLYCNTFLTCRGVDFNGIKFSCWLGFDGSFERVTDDSWVDHYTRSPCRVRTTCKTTYNDGQFERQPNTVTDAGNGFRDRKTLELCRLGCLLFSNRVASDFCVGFNFAPNNNLGVNCYLHTDLRRFKNTAKYSHHMDQYARLDCALAGIYYYI